MSIKLKEGIKVYSKLPLGDRIHLSSGIEKVNFLNGIRCTENTFVPREPWREPTRSEKEILFEELTDSKVPFQSIGVIKLPVDLVEEIGSLKLQEAHNCENVLQISRQANYKLIHQHILNFARTFQRSGDEAIIHNMACLEKELKTVTYHAKEQRYLGLHLDSWERKTIGEIQNARNRMCINLGKNDRYFLFINQEIKKLTSWINNYRNHKNPYKIIKDFLNENAEYPVVKLRIQPYEAYIAPTENIIHDGSSVGQEIMDIQLTLRSYYNVYRESLIV